MLTQDQLKETFRNFQNKKILIVGDVMIDAYIWGKVERISPEAPVPIVAVSKRENRLGGAANVALNIKWLGAEPVLCSVIGTDPKGKEFVELVRNEALPVNGICASRNRITTTKFRVIGNNTQLLRVDEEITSNLNESDENILLDTIGAIIETESIDAIVFQDYNKGVLTERVIRGVIALALENKIATVVDPKKINFNCYKNVTLFKPNLKELREGLNLDKLDDNQDLQHAAAALHEQMNIDILLATLSEKGVFISWKNDKGYESHIIPAHRRSIADVSGAGDTVVSVASLCLASGLGLFDLARISNLAGGIVCEDVGVVPVNKTRLLNEAIKLYP